MSKRSPFYKGLSSVAIYKRQVALLHFLESMESELPVELYQDMYARLLQLGNEKIVELYLSLEAGQSATVFNYLLKKGLYKEKAALQTNARKLRQARRKKLRKGFRKVS